VEQKTSKQKKGGKKEALWEEAPKTLYRVQTDGTGRLAMQLPGGRCQLCLTRVDRLFSS